MAADRVAGGTLEPDVARRRVTPDYSAAEAALLLSEGPLELNLFRSGVTCFCGVDEAGRGPLAGPVVAAAVVFVDDELIWSARDSKSLSRRRREELATRIRERFDFGIGMADAEEIDRINILQASLQAMARAVDALRARPSVMLVDGNQRVPHAVRSIAIVKGDARVRVISAASILAKVERDRIMHDLHILYPDYGFARHLGYPTSEHRAKLAKYGPCPIHRMTFRGVREHVRGAS